MEVELYMKEIDMWQNLMPNSVRGIAMPENEIVIRKDKNMYSHSKGKKSA